MGQEREVVKLTSGERYKLEGYVIDRWKEIRSAGRTWDDQVIAEEFNKLRLFPKTLHKGHVKKMRLQLNMPNYVDPEAIQRFAAAGSRPAYAPREATQELPPKDKEDRLPPVERYETAVWFLAAYLIYRGARLVGSYPEEALPGGRGRRCLILEGPGIKLMTRDYYEGDTVKVVNFETSYREIKRFLRQEGGDFAER